MEKYVGKQNKKKNVIYMIIQNYLILKKLIK